MGLAFKQLIQAQAKKDTYGCKMAYVPFQVWEVMVNFKGRLSGSGETLELSLQGQMGVKGRRWVL